MSIKSEIRRQIAQINKRVLNPLTLSFAGRPYVPYGMVQHIGRRSGKRYVTPVLVQSRGDTFVIPLPYGTETDWVRNVQAEGGALVLTGGRAVRVTDPRIVGGNVGGAAYPGWVRFLLEAGGTRHYLRVRRAAAEPQTVYRRVTADYPVSNGIVIVAALSLIGIVTAWVGWRFLQRD